MRKKVQKEQKKRELDFTREIKSEGETSKYRMDRCVNRGKWNNRIRKEKVKTEGEEAEEKSTDNWA